MTQTAGKPGIVLWHVTMSLDGFIAGPGDAMDWVFNYPDPPEVEEVIRTTGSVLAGRRSYDVGRRPGNPPGTRKVFGGRWTGPQFVLSHRPPALEEDASITFLSGDIGGAVARAKTAALGLNVLLIGASIARQSVEAGLVDEILVHLAPILLGDGIRFFKHQGAAGVPLEKLSVTQAGPLTNLRFRIKK